MRPAHHIDPALEEVAIAAEPPEARGLARDEVRLLAATGDGLHHRRFRELPDLLTPGDVLVVNVSATLPSAVDGRREDGRPVTVHLAGPSPDEDDAWVVELRRPDRQGPVLDGDVGETVHLRPDARLTLCRRVSGPFNGTRLWKADLHGPEDVPAWLHAHGRPIRYGYVRRAWPLAAYQTVFAERPGSAEMPSAGRPFTAALVTRLIARGVVVVPVTLHTGVSSPDAGEHPQPERYEVPATTARIVEDARRHGARIIAVGTTVVRALESVVDDQQRLHARAGWADLVLGPDRPARIVDGLITGWHDEDASHLDLLRAVAGPDLVDAAYAEARAHGYRWHEFGDSCLLLP